MLVALSILARLPAAMLSIGLLVHAQRLTGSFGAAGAVTATYAAALGVGGPLLGRMVDRRGQTTVLVGGALVAALALVAAAALPAGAPLAALLGSAAMAGVAMPPVGACLRTLLPGQLSDPSAVRSAFAVEATAVELTWIVGPPLVLALGHVWSTRAALTVAAALLAAATVAFAAQPASRAWTPGDGDARRSRGRRDGSRRAGLPAAVGRALAAARGGALASPALRTLVLVLGAVGVLFGAVEVAVTAAGGAAAGPLLGLWGAGSLAGGAVAARRGGGAQTPAGLALLLVALAAGHLALAAATGSAVALALVLAAAGSTIAPTYATVYGLVEDAAPTGTVTEAFSWLATAVAAGAAAGAAAAGVLTDAAGPEAAFVLAGVAGAAAALTATLAARSETAAAPAAA